MKLSGKISDLCRSLFGKDDPAWKPPAGRNDSPSKGQALPKGVEGRSLKGR
jgi:hypothetical protein